MPGLVWPNGSGSMPHVTSEFGLRFHPIDKVWRLHGGIDLVGFSTVCSPCDGQVIYAGYNGGFGNLVKIRAANRDEFWLAHNARFLVGYGAWVSAGQCVAIMGTTGASTGVHCHYETRPGGGAPVNPRDYHAQPSGGGGNTLPTEWDDMATREEVKAAVREVLAEPGGQMYANVAFLAGQANGWVSADRPADGQLATAISRITEILFAIDGRADPRIKGADGEPVKRAIAAFLESRPEAPSSGVVVDEAAIVEGVLAGLASDFDALVAVVKALPSETIAALKAAL